jgi:hypothetical protein
MSAPAIGCAAEFTTSSRRMPGGAALKTGVEAMIKILLLVVLAIALVAPTAKAVTYVGSATPACSASAASETVNYTPAAGHTVLINVITNGTITSIQNNNSFTYKILASNNAASRTVAFYGILSEASGVTSYTVNLSAASIVCITVHESSGVTNWGLKSHTEAAGSFSSTAISENTQSNNSLLVAAIWASSSGSFTATAGTIRQGGYSVGSDQAALMDNTSATPASVTDSVNLGANAGAYNNVAIELSSNQMNIFQIAHTPAGGCTYVSNACTVAMDDNPLDGDTIYSWNDWKTAGAFTVSSLTHGTDNGVACGSLSTENLRGFYTEVFLIPNVLAAQGSSIVITLTGNPGTSNGDMAVVEVDGASTSAPCDATGSSAAQGNSASLAMNAGSETATNAKTMQINTCSIYQGSSPFTGQSGWISDINIPNTFDALMTQSLYVTSAAAENPTWTYTNASPQAWFCNLTAVVSVPIVVAHPAGHPIYF